MWRTALSALLSHWRYRPVQLATLLIGLAVATALWSGVQAINAEARASYDRAAAVLGQDRLDSLVPRAGNDLSQDSYIALRRAGWQVSPVVEGSIRVGDLRLRILGIDPVTTPPQAALGAFEGGDGLYPFITPPGLAFTSAETARQIADATTALPPLRVQDDLAPGVVVMDIGIAQRLLGMDGRVSRLLLHPDQPLGRASLTDIAPDLQQRSPQAENDLARLTDSFHLNLTAFGLLSFAVGLFIVHAAIGLAFEQRRAMFRTLRALGVPVGTLIALLAAELLILAGLAGVIGVALGYLVASVLLPDVAASLRGLYGAQVSGVLTLNPAWWLSGLAIAIVGAGVAAASSLWRAARMPLLAPAQPRAWARVSERRMTMQAVAALLLWAGGGLAAWLGSGLIAGFALMGGLLLGAALMLPPILSLLLIAGERLARAALWQWFWADTRQQLPGLSLALMALLLALAANIGVGTMVSSFRTTFTGWLDQRLAAELYITAESEAQWQDISPLIANRSDRILPIWNTEITVRGAPVTLYGIADDATYRDNWPLLSQAADPWDQVALGTGAMINEQLARRQGFTVGEEITLLPGWTFQIVGVYSDYGNPTGQILINLPQLTARFPDVERLRYAVRMAPEGVAPLMAELQSRGLTERNMIDQAALKAFSVSVFERTFAVTAALNVLTLGVAAIAMLTSLLTLSSMRLPQLAPLWAMGLTRRRLAVLDLARTLLLALMTMIAALPVGLALAWVLLAVVNVEAFGWRLPMDLFPADWLRLGGLALLAAGIAAALPVRRLATINPADLVRVFAHER
ncbi:ABC transporter permease [Rubricella aquisinus]|nr:ABC transporter permease [Rubricella aquisinus]